MAPSIVPDPLEHTLPMEEMLVADSAPRPGGVTDSVTIEALLGWLAAAALTHSGEHAARTVSTNIGSFFKIKSFLYVGLNVILMRFGKFISFKVALQFRIVSSYSVHPPQTTAAFSATLAEINRLTDIWKCKEFHIRLVKVRKT